MTKKKKSSIKPPAELDKPCIECSYENPKNNPIINKLQIMKEHQEIPPKISNKKMFIPIEEKKSKTNSKKNKKKKK